MADTPVTFSPWALIGLNIANADPSQGYVLGGTSANQIQAANAQVIRVNLFWFAVEPTQPTPSSLSERTVFAPNDWLSVRILPTGGPL
jgi:hypothetical protein